MTDLEQQLRAEFGRQAEAAPDPAATERFAVALVGATATGRRWQVWLLPAVAALVLLVPAVTVLAVRNQHHPRPSPVAAGVSTNPADLVGVEWLLTSSVGPDGTSHPAPTGAQQQTLRFDGKGGISFSLNCNDAGGAVTLTPGRLKIGQIMTTLVGCGRGDDSMSLLDGSVPTLTWQIADHVLTIAAPDGSRLNFAVRTSIFPSEYRGSPGITIEQGKRGSADYRLFYTPASGTNVGFQFEWRDAPGSGWNEAGSAQQLGWTGPQPDWNGGCQPADIAGERYLAGWATAKAARVSVHTPAGVNVNVALHTLTGTGSLRVYAGFIGQAPKGSTVTVYDSAGKPLGQPCPFGS